MDHVNFTKTPGCFDQKASEEFSDLAIEPMVANGTIFVPGHDLMCGVKKVPEGMAYVAIMTRVRDAGLYHSLTPEGARQFAQSILGAADAAEEHGRNITAAKLDATLAKRPQP